MRGYQFTHEARAALDGQLDYLISQHAQDAAAALNVSVHAFIRDTLARYPATGRHLADRNLWETWIPKTRLVIWYTFTDDILTVVAVWHTAQDRERS